MSLLSRLRLPGGMALLFGALIFACGMPGAGAQCIPGASINLTRPSSGAQNLAGTVRVEFNRTTPPPSSWQWNATVVRIYSGNGDPMVDPIVEENSPTEIGTGTGEFFYQWDTTQHPNGTYTIYAIANIDQPAAPFGHAQCWSSPVTVTIQNPYSVCHANRSSLFCPCRCDAVATGSSTSPLSGHQSFTVPITSWNYKGMTVPFALEYNSHALIDPQRTAEAPDFNGLSERNSHWSHPYAMWIDLFQNESGKQYAVWHQGSSSLAFEKSGTNFLSPDSSNTLTFGGGSITSPSFPCAGGTQTLMVSYGYFIAKDGAGTSYEFNYLPPMGQTHLLWQTGQCQAIPYYLLSRIRDRWGRVLTITWDSDPAEPRVTEVRDDTGAGLVLGYMDRLLHTVQDPQGRTHTLSYTAVPDEFNTNRQKLTGVTVYGPGSPNRTVRTWGFAYQDAADPGTAYGGRIPAILSSKRRSQMAISSTIATSQSTSLASESCGRPTRTGKGASAGSPGATRKGQAASG